MSIQDCSTLNSQVEAGWSLTMMAKYWDRDKRTIGRWLKKHKLETKKIPRFFYGEDHPNFEDGSSRYKRKMDPRINSVIEI